MLELVSDGVPRIATVELVLGLALRTEAKLEQIAAGTDVENRDGWGC